MKPGQALRAERFTLMGAADCNRDTLRDHDTFNDVHDAASYYDGWNRQALRRQALRDAQRVQS